ncbi:hypothetical protein [Myceligenerans crystallogenes]|uniref:REase associating with pPIWI RE domain-containing protein n=1 Tax=Myceligenerans crystallogenes TaxID=316335 RepID=A0ABP4ZU27_9MICO
MPDLMEETSFLAGLAAAVSRLAMCEVPGKSAYDDVVQRAYNHFVLRTLVEDDYKTPRSVPEMIEIIADRPVQEWLPGSTSDTILLHGDTRSPTQECTELVVDNRRDPFGEKYENEILKRALTACHEAEAPDSYVAFRRLLITRPTMTHAELMLQRGELDLLPVADLLERCYLGVSPRLRRDGSYAECARCRCLLRPVGKDGWRCDLDRCRTTKVKVRQYLDATTPGGIVQLSLPLRTFVTGPGLFEIDLEVAMNKRGLKVEMWPEYDAYDLLVTFPDNNRWAVDVKDYANPGVLGRTFTGFPSAPPRDRAFLVVPDYRRTANKQYAENFRYSRQSAGRGDSLVVTFQKDFLQQVDQMLASTTTPEGSNA